MWISLNFNLSEIWYCNFQALSGLDYSISRQARFLGNTALDAALNAQFLVQIGVFTAVPMIMGFILELGLMKVVFCFEKYISSLGLVRLIPSTRG